MTTKSLQLLVQIRDTIAADPEFVPVKMSNQHARCAFRPDFGFEIPAVILGLHSTGTVAHLAITVLFDEFIVAAVVNKNGDCDHFRTWPHEQMQSAVAWAIGFVSGYNKDKKQI